MQGDSEKHQGGIESLLSLELLIAPLCNPLCRDRWNRIERHFVVAEAQL